MYSKLKSYIIEFGLLLIITVPAFGALLNSSYFSMHDDQHIARLFVLVKGIEQGNLFPRWVDMLGFGYGYPLFNFYPPLIYYIASGFHFLGFSLIWSIKLMLITGFLLSALGCYLLIKSIIGKLSAYLGATIYTYFFYHAITVYVRGAFAEFFSLAILPFVFLGMYLIYKKQDFGSVILFSISFAFLILTHPLIAFPALLFIGIFFVILFFGSKSKLPFVAFTSLSGLLALGLSSFYWLPSMIERKFTLTDSILTQELANYKDHYIYLTQLWYSPWGFGGSTKGLGDGLSFQLGKIPILLAILSITGFLYYFFKKRKFSEGVIFYCIFVLLLLVSLFMATPYSSFIWENLKYLWYMQFPWRMLTFSALFISICGGFSIYFIRQIEVKEQIRNKLKILQGKTHIVFTLLIILIILKYSPYFQPQQFIRTTDKERTKFNEIAWNVSSTSYEFVPKGVETTKTKLGTTTLAINQFQLPSKPYEILEGKANVKVLLNNYSHKQFVVDAVVPTIFRLNTYNFPGWKGFKDGKEMAISDNNRLKLITINLEKGRNMIEFRYGTLIQSIGNICALISFTLFGILCTIFFVKNKRNIKKYHNLDKD